MTNFTIIANAAIQSGLYMEDEILEHVNKYGCLPFYTFNIISKAGGQIRKGEHAKFKANIWIPKTKTKKDGSEVIKEVKFFNRMTAFFTLDQCKNSMTGSDLKPEFRPDKEDLQILTDNDGFCIPDETECLFA